jgi:D-3-phosphoglycerate dehydrogenase
MKKNKVIYYEMLNYQPENLKLLNENFEVITLPTPAHDKPQIFNQADVIFAPLGYYCGRDKIDQSTKLKVIASNTTGHPHIDVNYAAQKGIQVITLKGHNEFLNTITPTAELTWGLIISLTRKIFPAYQSVLKGSWNRRSFGGASMLSRMSLGVAGYGRLGRMVANYGKSFGMKVRYYDPFVENEDVGVFRVNTLTELVSTSDIITIHIPHEPETEGLFNKKIFTYFKKGAYLINTSRGELIDHDALLECLKDGTLAGAALDVLDGEYKHGFKDNIKDHPLWKYAQEHDNLIITPHIGGSTVDAWKMTEEYTIKLIITALNRETDKKKS